jgi:hypothetical protein
MPTPLPTSQLPTDDDLNSEGAVEITSPQTPNDDWARRVSGSANNQHSSVSKAGASQQMLLALSTPPLPIHVPQTYNPQPLHDNSNSSHIIVSKTQNNEWKRHAKRRPAISLSSGASQRSMDDLAPLSIEPLTIADLLQARQCTGERKIKDRDHCARTSWCNML